MFWWWFWPIWIIILKFDHLPTSQGTTWKKLWTPTPKDLDISTTVRVNCTIAGSQHPKLEMRRTHSWINVVPLGHADFSSSLGSLIFCNFLGSSETHGKLPDIMYLVTKDHMDIVCISIKYIYGYIDTHGYRKKMDWQSECKKHDHIRLIIFQCPF